MHAALLVLTAALAMGQTFSVGPPPAADTIPLTSCLVTLIDEVEVPAEEQGVLKEIPVKEGDKIKEGELMAQIDDKQAQAMAVVAQCKLDVAKEEASNDVNKRYARWRRRSPKPT